MFARLSCGLATVLIVLLVSASGCGPVDAEVELRAAAQAAADGQWRQALTSSGRVLSMDAHNIEAMVLNGISAYELRQIEDALEMLDTAATMAPDFFPAQYFYGWALHETQRYGDALKPLYAAHKLRPDHTDTLVLLSRCCLRQNLPQGLSYLQALQRLPSFAAQSELHNSLGMLWLKQGRYEQARRSLREAIAKDQANPVAYQNLAVLYDHYLNDPNQAIRYYRFCLSASQQSRDEVRASKVRQRLVALARKRQVQP